MLVKYNKGTEVERLTMAKLFMENLSSVSVSVSQSHIASAIQTLQRELRLAVVQSLVSQLSTVTAAVVI